MSVGDERIVKEIRLLEGWQIINDRCDIGVPIHILCSEHKSVYLFKYPFKLKIVPNFPKSTIVHYEFRVENGEEENNLFPNYDFEKRSRSLSRKDKEVRTRDVYEDEERICEDTWGPEKR